MLDLLVYAKEIITLDSERQSASVMGVFAGKIVGFDEEVTQLPAAQELDFGDAVITPGFIDSHCHATWWGLGLNAIQLDTARGLTELYDMIAEAAAQLPDSGEVWIHGTGFNQKHHGGSFPDIGVLDKITGQRRLYLRHTSGHAAITNTATLQRLGALDPGFVDPVGGRIVRDGDGNPTGLVEESAQGLLQAMLLPYPTSEITAALESATARFAARGITSFVEAGVGGGWIGHSPIEVAAYLRAANTARLKARAIVMPAIDSLEQLRGADQDFCGEGSGLGVGLGVGFGFGTEMVRLGHVKAFMDGSLLGETAAVTAEYCQHHTKHRGSGGSTHPQTAGVRAGYLLDTPENYREAVRAVYRGGWPVALHAIGDAAIDLALELIAQCQTDYGKQAAPNRIEHFGIARPDQVALAAQLGIAVTPQAGFIGPLGDQFMAKLGPERQSWIYRGQSIVDAGAILAGSSDLPVADNNILRAMQSAVDRRTESGAKLAPAEALSPLNALRSYTCWAARANGVADQRGTLRRGYNADFVVLSGSPLTAENIAELRVLATYLGGECSFSAE